MAVVGIMMAIILVLGVFVAPLLLAISLISPRIGLFWSKDKSKKKAYIVYLSAFALSLVMAIVIPSIILAFAPDALNTPAPESAVISSSAFDPWPYSVPGEVLCMKQDAQVQHVVLRTAEGQLYAINGTARSSGQYLDSNFLWLDDPAIPGTKINTGDVISRGLALCR